MKLEIINENGIETIKMFRVAYYSKKAEQIFHCPFYTTYEKAVKSYKKTCNIGIREYDPNFKVQETYLFE